MYTRLFLLTCLLAGASVAYEQLPYEDFDPERCQECDKDWEQANECRWFGETTSDAECKVLYKRVYKCEDSSGNINKPESMLCSAMMPVQAKMMPCEEATKADCPYARENFTMALVGATGKWWASKHAGIVAFKDDEGDEGWGAMCDDQATDNEAAMLCTRYFGHAYGRRVPSYWFDQEEEMRFAVTNVRCMNPYEFGDLEEHCTAEDYYEAMAPCHQHQKTAIVCYDKPFHAELETEMKVKKNRVLFKVRAHIVKHGIKLNSFDFADRSLSIHSLSIAGSNATDVVHHDITDQFRYKRRRGTWVGSAKMTKEEREEKLGGCVFAVGSLDHMPAAVSILTPEKCAEWEVTEEDLMEGVRDWYKEQMEEDEEEDENENENESDNESDNED